MAGSSLACRQRDRVRAYALVVETRSWPGFIAGHPPLAEGQCRHVEFKQASGGMRQLSVRTGVIHRSGKLLRQNFGDLIDRYVEPCGQLLDRVAAQYLMQLLGCDRQVLTVSDPGFDLIAEARLLQLCNDRREAALIAIAKDFAQHHRKHSAPKLAEGVLERG